jgi:hypothetical protein
VFKIVSNLSASADNELGNATTIDIGTAVLCSKPSADGSRYSNS